MPININYSRKIAELLKVIGCDKRKAWRREFFPAWNSSPGAAKFITIIIIAHDVPDSMSSPSQGAPRSRAGLMKKLFLLFHSTNSDIFPLLLLLLLVSFYLFSTWTNFMKSDGMKQRREKNKKSLKAIFPSCHKKQHGKVSRWKDWERVDGGGCHHSRRS